MTRKRRQEPPHHCRGPVAPGSTFYQLLQMIARAVAEELAKGAKDERGGPKRKTKDPR
jgi:hypothetical protein